MNNDIEGDYDQRDRVLRIRVRSYGDAVKAGELTDEFLDCLLGLYRGVDDSERRKSRRTMTVLQRLREVIRKRKKESGLPVRQIHVYPRLAADLKSQEIRNAIANSIGAEAEVARVKADRWELFEDVAVGADLVIDVSAMSTGLARFISSGELKEGIAGFGYLAMVGMALLIAYFVVRIVGEEPCKRRSRYLTRILRTPVTLHRRFGHETELTFLPDAEERASEDEPTEE